MDIYISKVKQMKTEFSQYGPNVQQQYFMDSVVTLILCHTGLLARFVATTESCVSIFHHVFSL